MKKVIVTGATGFIGRRLSETLMAQGVEVYGIGRNQEVLDKLAKNPLFCPINAEFGDYSNLDQKISERGFDVFYHIAHLGVNGTEKSDYRIQLMNTTISCDAVISAKKLACERFLLTGSVDEYEANIKLDAPFISPSHSRIYGIAKFASENIGKTIALKNGIEFVSVLLSLTYGEGNKTRILPNTIIRNAAIGQPIKLISGNNLFDMNYIDETVGGIIAAAEKGHNLESYYVGHHDLSTFRETVIRICDVIDAKSELLFGEYPDPDYNIDYSSINKEKLYMHTGYKCKADFAESLLKTREWLLVQDNKT